MQSTVRGIQGRISFMYTPINKETVDVYQRPRTRLKMLLVYGLRWSSSIPNAKQRLGLCKDVGLSKVPDHQNCFAMMSTVLVMDACGSAGNTRRVSLKSRHKTWQMV